MKLDPELPVLKTFRVHCSNFVLVFSHLFKNFHDTVMIYNTRNQRNDTTESWKE